MELEVPEAELLLPKPTMRPLPVPLIQVSTENVLGPAMFSVETSLLDDEFWKVAAVF